MTITKAQAKACFDAPVDFRLWLESFAMGWRTDMAAGKLGAAHPEAIKAKRRDCVELIRRARLDPKSTSLRRLPG